MTDVRRSAHIRPIPLQKVARRQDSLKAREAVDAYPGPSHDPDRAVGQFGVDHVGIGDVLKPAGHGIEPDPARWAQQSANPDWNVCSNTRPCAGLSHELGEDCGLHRAGA